MMSPDSLAAVVVAAGAGRRFGGDKLFRRLGNRPLLAWSLDALEESPLVSLVVLVLSEANLERGRHLIQRRRYAKVRAICLGGRRRQDSVWNGVRQAAGWNWIAIQDGARPFLTQDILTRGWETARRVGGAVAAVPVKDTIKIVGPGEIIASTPTRAHLWAAQTPQIFRYEWLATAYQVHGEADVTDDGELMERAGFPTAVFQGAEANLKVTTLEDLTLARAIARRARRA
ncbi:MAG: 2-C-methyl-D-erythritol 4-phosphate cytidylyltransferase [Chloroflexota bacterium]